MGLHVKWENKEIQASSLSFSKLEFQREIHSVNLCPLVVLKKKSLLMPAAGFAPLVLTTLGVLMYEDHYPLLRF